MHLTLENLAALPSGVLKPNYDRSDLSPGIVHIGLGNFHRAHQAWYLHQLMQDKQALDWAVLGAGVRCEDANRRTKMLKQDCLTTLIELAPSGKSVEVVGSMIDYIPVLNNNAALITNMAQKTIRIVSLTVTEGGYYQTGLGTFDKDHTDIQYDAAHPKTPKTAFGAMIAALQIRKDNGAGPFTCLSCDNLQSNGQVLSQTILGLARLSSPDLAEWIEQNVTFPNSMVDCIVPATGPTELELVQSFGIDDCLPVTHENFRQWVIEDKFCAGRPEFEKVGVTFTDNVHNFEAMKLRLLNAGHQLIAAPAELLSISTISDAMGYPLISQLFRKIETEEIVPHVSAVPGMTPLAYVDLIEKRFANPEIGDTTRRVAFDGSARHPGFIHPVLRDAIAQNMPLDGLALGEALWARMCAGWREDGTMIESNDPSWENLVTHAIIAKDCPAEWRRQYQLYGDLGRDIQFGVRFDNWLHLIWSQGTEKAIQVYLES